MMVNTIRFLTLEAEHPSRQKDYHGNQVTFFSRAMWAAHFGMPPEKIQIIRTAVRDMLASGLVIESRGWFNGNECCAYRMVATLVKSNQPLVSSNQPLVKTNQPITESSLKSSRDEDRTCSHEPSEQHLTANPKSKPAGEGIVKKTRNSRRGVRKESENENASHSSLSEVVCIFESLTGQVIEDEKHRENLTRANGPVFEEYGFKWAHVERWILDDHWSEFVLSVDPLDYGSDSLKHPNAAYLASHALEAARLYQKKHAAPPAPAKPTNPQTTACNQLQTAPAPILAPATAPEPKAPAAPALPAHEDKEDLHAWALSLAGANKAKQPPVAPAQQPAGAWPEYQPKF
ncbi:hypothetical protein [Trinickia mobilis]|uniref:hypothetical protein n=1 Tax=Trinickia mobilis TaxID=2816356 RepID=UPI001A90708E|nr:hypothetical protein [Trinickia mobilis]